MKWILCDNLGELVEEFKKFRNSQSPRNKYEDYNFLQMLRFDVVRVEGGVVPSEILSSVQVYQKDGVDLALNLAPLHFKEKAWVPYSQKVEKILKEIWETGEVKDYQGLDLNWPAVSQPNKNQPLNVCCDQCGKYIGEEKLAWFSDRKKNLDFCSETCHSKFKKCQVIEKENQELKEKLKKETKYKNIWTATSVVAVSAFALLLLFSGLKKKKKKK
jgi:hypothetical protein